MEKLTLKEAKEKATKITGNIPTIGTLRNWVNKGLISSPVDYINRGKAGGRIGLYPGSLPVEIATAIYLKSEGYKIGEIAQVRKEIIKGLRNMSNEIEDMELMKSNLMENIKNERLEIQSFFRADKQKTKDEMEEMLENLKLSNLKMRYTRTYKEFSQELKEVEGVK